MSNTVMIKIQIAKSLFTNIAVMLIFALAIMLGGCKKIILNNQAE
jgi:hypothetical protein